MPCVLFALFWLSPVQANAHTLIVDTVADTFLSLASPDPAHGTQPFLAVGRFDQLEQTRILLRFAPITLPEGAIVTEASLQLWQYLTPFDNDIVIIRQITNAWDETAIWGSVTFDNTINYAEFNFPIHNGSPQLTEIPLPLTLIERLTNGIMLRYLDESRPGSRLCSREAGGVCSAAHAPRLILRYALNEAPTTPILIAPTNLTQVCDTATRLEWNASTDPNGTPPSYRVFWGIENPPTQIEETNATQIDLPSQNAVYYWQVEAFDPAGATSPRSELRQFTANCNPNPPQAIHPPPDSQLCAPSIRFTWTPAQDPDQGALTYTLYLDGQDSREYRDLDAHEITLNDLYGVYTWQVEAIDPFGAVSERSPVRQFIANCPPTTPIPLTPLPNTVICDQAIQFTWSGDNDPEHDRLHYRLSVNHANQSLTYLIENQTTFTLDHLHGELTWQVEAIDSYGLASAPSTPQIAIDNCAPTPPQVIAPSDQSVFCAGRGRLSWSQSIDADLETIAYDLYFGTITPPPLYIGLIDTYHDLSLANGVYYWRVQARDALGFIGSSAIQQFTIDCPNLIQNGGFEVDHNHDMLPDSWRFIRRTRDRLSCEPLIANNGACALMFQGGAGENVKLIQTIQPTLIAGEALVFSALYRTNSIPPRLRVILTITYLDGSTHSVVAVINTASNRVYTQFSLPPIPLTQNVQTIQIVWHNRGTAGKVFLDDLQLTVQPPS
ncbi:MAG: DNRLRE domain-containing protein [Anaerolineae bacterium]|nr:DNRLRE domain-containing protein [Anaerolineae bacterium]